MAKVRGRRVYLCQQCGEETPQWLGKCPHCGAMNAISETPLQVPEVHPSPRSWSGATLTEPQELATLSHQEERRLPLPSGEMNRVLGGGLVPGSLVLMAGEPGVGKSTLLLQMGDAVAAQYGKTLYLSGEESAYQVKMRAHRLGIAGQHLYFLAETDVEEALARLDQMRPTLAIVDSIQTLATVDIASSPGSVAQVRECTRRLLQWAKAREVPLLLAGHVTKEGDVAGPRVLEHMVDVVLYLEGEPLSTLRLLRSVKNRFGSTNEVGVFQMESRGLVEVEDPSRALLAQRREDAIGSAIVPVLEGTRPLLVEVQALTFPSGLAVPRRIASGFETNRLVMLAAVVAQRTGLATAGQDIILNIAGGLRIAEPAADLAVALALASSLRQRPLPTDLVALGEVGLTGELRSVPQVERRLSEAARLGFRRCLLPPAGLGHLPRPKGLQLQLVESLAAALRAALPREQHPRKGPAALEP
ncbi:MAG: DNA repair protein RadA [Dehalococcoidia bacterium]